MFIDTSAFVSILAREPDAGVYLDCIERSLSRSTSPVVRLEACLVLSGLLDVPVADVTAAFDQFIALSGIEIVPITDEIGQIAVKAFERFGKGCGNRAQLNLADCLSYAVARAHGEPILFKGRDFTHTDLASAI